MKRSRYHIPSIQQANVNTLDKPDSIQSLFFFAELENARASSAVPKTSFGDDASSMSANLFL